ncbi:MAG: hypothetical protein ACYC4M_04715 [Thermoleophilia bacterium]
MSDVCASILIASGWLKPRELAALPRERWRPALIDELARRGIDDVRALRSRLNEELALAAEIYLYLVDAGIHPRDAAAMTGAGRRERLLAELNQRRGTAIESMQGCDDRRLLAIAEPGLLRERLEPLVSGLEAVGAAGVARFGLADDEGRSMDALRILPLGQDSCLGIYHTRVDDAFQLRVARSSDLVEWTRVADLGSHNHQGDIKPLGKGFLVASEVDEPRRGNHLRLRHFDSLEELAVGAPRRDLHLPRTFSRLNEGTPDIRVAEGDGPEKSTVLVGFHYYCRRGLLRRVDRLAAGVLTGFSSWRCWTDVTANRAIERLGFDGNIGGRHSFRYDGGTWFIQEAQRRWKDWSSWRVLLGNGRSYIQLEPRTPGASRSFANPGLARLPTGGYAATLFLPHQGNVAAEEGELVFSFDMSH